MAILIVTSQIVENYGSIEEPYWKFKGTNQYIVRDVEEDELEHLIPIIHNEIEFTNDFYNEYVISTHHIESTDYIANYDPDYVIELNKQGETIND